MPDWIRTCLATLGLPGVALLMAAENVFPPLPSEVIMPLAGMVASEGGLSFVGVLVAGWIGSFTGAASLYGVGWWLGEERVRSFGRRYGSWLLVRPSELERAIGWFDRHGGKTVLLGRLVPGVRSLVSIPAGVCAMPLGRFLVLTAIGTSVWVVFLGSIGYWLGEQSAPVQRWIGRGAWIVIGGLVVAHVVRALRERRRRGGSA